MTTLEQSIETYIHAKDGNRPHLIAQAFAPAAELVMDVKTGTIAFPSAVVGAGEIARVLVSEFAQQYENVYTLCIGAPPAAAADAFDCDWLVCMSEKRTGAARVGYGRYAWRSEGAHGLVTHLRITIEAMHVLPAVWNAPILEWVSALPYPWCPAGRLAVSAPDQPDVQRVVVELQRAG
jgi:hypothetical protein